MDSTAGPALETITLNENKDISRDGRGAFRERTSKGQNAKESASSQGPTQGGLSDGVAQQSHISGKTVAGPGAHSNQTILPELNFALGSIDEMDPIFTDTEASTHMCQALYLQNLEGSIQDREWRDHLAGKPAGYVSMSVADGASTRGVGGGTSAAAEAAHTKKKLKAQRELLRVMAKRKLNGIERAAVLVTSNTMVAGINDDCDAPNAGVEAAPKDLDGWWDHRQNGQQFVGLGYGASISSFIASRTSFKSDIPKMTHAERRMLRRENRLQEGGEFLLAIDTQTSEHPPAGPGETLDVVVGASASSIPKSYVFNGEVLSVVDTGATVTVIKDGTVLGEFDPKSAVRILGFNGSITRSTGKGVVVGYAKTRDGRQVGLRVPNAHSVKGAPNDLLSVSALVALGYEFHFTAARSWVVTPELEILDLLEKGGLFWLKWIQANDPRVLVDHARGTYSTVSASARVNVVGNGAAIFDGPSRSEATAAAEVFVRDEVSRNVDEQPDEAKFELQGSGEPGLALIGGSCRDGRCEVCSLAALRTNLPFVRKLPSISLELLHRRMAHFDHGMLEHMVNKGALDVRLADKVHRVCDICRANKITRRSVPRQREHEPVEEKPFGRVWTDVKGPVSRDFWGNRYMVTFTCEVTRWSCVYFCRKKSEVKDRLVEFLEYVKRLGHVVKVISSDGGGEYTASEFASVASDFNRICADRGITQTFTSPYTPEQNGVSERLNRTLIEHATSLLHESALAKEFWSFAVKHVCWLRNRLWHRSLQKEIGVGISPFQALFGRAPHMTMARVWGCDAWALDHSFVKSSFEPKGKKMIFVGISVNRKGWVLFDPKTRKVRTTYHCTFDESLEGRRCALLDYELRQKKAGPDASFSDEQLKMQSDLYDRSADIVPSVHDDDGHDDAELPRAQSEAQGFGRVTRSATSSGDQGGAASEGGEGDVSHPDHEGKAEQLEGATGLRDGGSIAGSEATPKVSIPERRAAVGSEQGLDEDDKTFLRRAFEADLPVEFMQRNQKLVGSKSRFRYEGYKSATTLRMAKQLGASWEDLVWDYSRGFIDFSHPEVASMARIGGKQRHPFDAGISVSPAAYVDASFSMVLNGPMAPLSFEESIQHDYAVLAVEHLESKSHREQRLLQRALGSQTLTQFAHCCAARILIPEPLSVDEAMASGHADEWRAAMDEEIGNLVKFHCYDVVPRAEAIKHGRLVKSKWVFKVKFNSDNTVQRFRARLVAKGFTQVPGSDFYETFSPVFGYTSLRTVFALAAARDLQLDQWDLKNSFIQQDIDVEHMYMECPDGYDKHLANGQPASWHLKKSIYGLRQSSRLLHTKLSALLLKMGFTQLLSDQCVFSKGSGDSQIIVCTWVDDIILAAKRENQAARVEFDRALRSEFEVSPWTSGEAGWILNMNVQRNWKAGTLHLSQPGAIEKLAARFELDGREGYAPKVPMDPNLKLTKPSEDQKIPVSEFDYQAAVGSLLYLSLTARPDIAQCVGVLSRFMSCPGVEHVETAKRVIRYLFGTKDMGIMYSREITGAPHLYVKTGKNRTCSEQDLEDSRLMYAYADADLAGDDYTRKSTSGFACVLHGGVICWTSKLQSTVALSTAEAETNAGVEAVKQLMHLRLFLRELGQEQTSPSTVFEDNNAAIALAHNKEQSKRAKHYQMKVHFLNEQLKRGVFSYVRVDTRNQLADCFTKALPRDDFARYRDMMGVKLPSVQVVSDGVSVK